MTYAYTHIYNICSTIDPTSSNLSYILEPRLAHFLTQTIVLGIGTLNDIRRTGCGSNCVVEEKTWYTRFTNPFWRGGSCSYLHQHCDVAICWPALPEGKGANGIAFSGGSFPYSKLLGCRSNWPGTEQSGLLPDICQRRAALYGSRVTSFCFLFAPWGDALEHPRYLLAKGRKPSPLRTGPHV